MDISIKKSIRNGIIAGCIFGPLIIINEIVNNNPFPDISYLTGILFGGFSAAFITSFLISLIYFYIKDKLSSKPPTTGR